MRRSPLQHLIDEVRCQARPLPRFARSRGATLWRAVDPHSMLGMVGDNAAMAEVAREARARLVKVIAAVGR